MKWFKKIVASWAREGRNYEEDCAQPNRLISTAECASINDAPVLNFKVYTAVGGKVVEFRRYYSKTDRNDSTTYIITNDQDFGDRIAKIATMEKLKL
jgi:hypothetical protein